MIPFNTEFQTGQSKITQIRITAVLANNTSVNITEHHVLLGGFIRDTSTTIDGEFTIGAAVTEKITVILDNSSDTFSGYDFRGAVLAVSLGGQLSDETYQLITIGTYTADEYVYDGSNITITAYDNLHKFNKPCKDSSVSFPQTVASLVSTACTEAGVIVDTACPNGTFTIEEEPETWDTMTWHDVIAYCAQIGCCYAKILPNGHLTFAWYNTSFFFGGQMDGGTFGTQTTPYYDGAIADGGDFTYAATTDYDGGHFGDRDDAHNLIHLFDLTVDTDDVMITGVNVLLTAENNVDADDDTADYEAKRGTDGYRIRIENNPLIETTTQADFIASYIYDIIGGMRFRPLNASVLENPAVEAGDCALVVDRSNNTYTCFLSHVVYTTGANTSVSCDAVSSMQNLKARYGEAEKTRALVTREFQRSLSTTEDAMEQILSAVATTMGLNRFQDTDEHGNTIWTYGNGDKLVNSQIRWRLSAGAFMVSNNYGASWNAAISAEGIAVFQAIYAVKVVADNIVSGMLTVGGQNNKDCVIDLYDSSGVLCGKIDNSGIKASGVYFSYDLDNGYATKIKQGKVLTYSGIYSYSDLDRITDTDSNGSISSATAGSVSGLRDLHGINLVSPKDFVVIGKRTGEDLYVGYFFVNITGKINGYNERILINDNVRLVNGCLHLKSVPNNIKTAIKWFASDNDNAYAFLGYSEKTNTFNMRRDDTSASNLWVGNLTATGSKHRAVDTKNYGKIGMNAFETASSHFADIGSGMVGNDGTVTIFFDPVFVETIEINSEYQVFITRTSEAQTSWVDKQNGYFVVHGDPGATFDWMIVGYQKDYVTNRMEVLEPPEEYINEDPIVPEDTSAIDAVQAMVDEYNDQLEDLNND